jgi:hypothetical protein
MGWPLSTAEARNRGLPPCLRPGKGNPVSVSKAADIYRDRVTALAQAKAEQDALQLQFQAKKAEVENLRELRDQAYTACLTEVQTYGQSGITPPAGPPAGPPA